MERPKTGDIPVCEKTLYFGMLTHAVYGVLTPARTVMPLKCSMANTDQWLATPEQCIAFSLES